MTDTWPALSAEEFNKTSYLLFMCIQMIGKIMLTKPFEPHWGNLVMPLTSRGVTTGIIFYQTESFTIDVDFIDHAIIATTSTGKTGKIKLCSMSVAELLKIIFEMLASLGVHIKINLKPQETSNTTPFDQDTLLRVYDEKVVNTWWRIMLNTTRILQKYHAKFYGITPPIGLCWGTLDLRDARYKGEHLPKTPATSSFIARNSMDDSQVEVGWSCSNEKYPVPAFFSFAYPNPEELSKVKMKPDGVKWVAAVNEFILDYDELLKSKNPDEDLMLFFESYYQAVAQLNKWGQDLIVSGKPI